MATVSLSVPSTDLQMLLTEIEGKVHGSIILRPQTKSKDVWTMQEKGLLKDSPMKRQKGM